MVYMLCDIVADSISTYLGKSPKLHIKFNTFLVLPLEVRLRFM